MLIPGIMISQTFPNARLQSGRTLDALHECLKREFFRAVHLPDISERNERVSIRRELEYSDIGAIYCITRALNESGLNLSHPESGVRGQAVLLAQRQLEYAKEAGARAVDLVSGMRPENISDRPEALRCLEESLFEICSYESGQKLGVRVGIEALDFDFHKKNTLGTTDEAVAICKRLRADGEQLWLCLDTAHLALNGEPIPQAIEAAANYTDEFHLCNCCTEKDSPYGGDYHIPPGEPGVFDTDDYSRFARILQSKTDRDIPVFCEILKADDISEIRQLDLCESVLRSIGL